VATAAPPTAAEIREHTREVTRDFMERSHSVLLTEVNHLRKQFDLPPIDKMPKGMPRRPARCPLACALGATGLQEGVYVRTGSPGYIVRKRKPGHVYEGISVIYDQVTLPDTLNQFVRAFDDGHYPELME
jgi:hypothetical protein